MRKNHDSKAVALKEYYDNSPISTYTKVSIFSRNDRGCKDVDLQKTRKRYVIIKSSNLTRNIFWLASCFFKNKETD